MTESLDIMLLVINMMTWLAVCEAALARVPARSRNFEYEALNVVAYSSISYSCWRLLSTSLSLNLDYAKDSGIRLVKRDVRKAKRVSLAQLKACSECDFVEISLEKLLLRRPHAASC